MPLTNLQTEILRILANQRDPESYVAGATPLNRRSLRFSDDIDIFQDRAERVAASALKDAELIQSAGYVLRWLRQMPLTYTAEVLRGDEATRLEWVADSDYRFFPTIRDDTFGYLLHPVDLAANKVMAAAGRRELRDLVDLTTVHERILTLGAVVWAAVDKSPGFTPEGLIEEIRRSMHYPAAEWRALSTSEPLDPKLVTAKLRDALDDAEAFVSRMPTSHLGLLFLAGPRVVQPDPDHLEQYLTHSGQRRGHWPSSAEITAAMFELAARDLR